jgi:hypothetical protein
VVGGTSLFVSRTLTFLMTTFLRVLSDFNLRLPVFGMKRAL